MASVTVERRTYTEHCFKDEFAGAGWTAQWKKRKPFYMVKVDGRRVDSFLYRKNANAKASRLREELCAASSSSLRSAAKTSTKPSSTASMPTPASEIASSVASPHMPPTESSLGHSMTPFPPKGTKE
jgi:hypothetical protein